jgi:signal peptidase II
MTTNAREPGPASRWIFQRKVLWLIVVLVVGVGVDQGSKIWAQSTLASPSERAKLETVVEDGKRVDRWVPGFRHDKTVVVVPDAFDLIYRENPAAAFSLTRSIPEWLRRPMLLGVSTFAMFLIGLWYLRLKKPDGLLMTSFALIIAGAVGNFIDRLRFGYVVDMIDVYLAYPPLADPLVRWFGTAHWPTFNIADSCIVGGAIGVIWRTMRPLYPEDDETPPPPAPAPAPTQEA